MSQLIKTFANSKGAQAVSARDLHAFLEVSNDFTTWCKRMFEYGFSEGVDYSFLKMGEPDNQAVANPNPKVDFALTLECAKEISMLQRTDKGKEARLYFIQKEKEALQVIKTPSNYIEALKALLTSEEEKLVLQYELSEAKPKIEFFDQVADSKDAIEIGQAAKVLNMGIGRNTLFEILRDNAILMHNNAPYQKYLDRGWFRVVEQSYQKPDGTNCINIKTLVYQKGLQEIAKVIQNRRGLAVMDN